MSAKRIWKKSPPSPNVPSGLRYEKQFHPMLRYCCMPSCNSMMSKTRKALILEFCIIWNMKTVSFHAKLNKKTTKIILFEVLLQFVSISRGKKALTYYTGFNPAKNSVFSFRYISRILRPRSLIAFDMFDILQ